MRTLLIPCIGSRGDVQPFIALSTGLKKMDPTLKVVLGAHREFEQFVTSHDLLFFEIEPSILQFLKETEQGKALKKANIFNMMGVFKSCFTLLYDSWVESVAKNVDLHKPDVLLLPTIVAQCGVLSLINKYPEMKVYAIHTVPAFPTREFLPPTSTLGYSFPFQWINKKIWVSTEKMFHEKANKPIIEAVCKKHGLEPWKVDLPLSQAMADINSFYIYSQEIVPIPKDWPNTQRVVGFLRYSSLKNESLSPELEAFAQKSRQESVPLIYIGLGSMLSVAFDDRAKSENILNFLLTGLNEALKKTNFYAILHTVMGKDDAIELPSSEKIFVLTKPVSHDVLFDYCSLVVHHGGAGTTQTALVHGVPGIVLPCVNASDQPFWAIAVEKTGCGVNGGLISKQSQSKFSKLIVNTLSKITDMKQKAKMISEAMLKEDPIKSFHDVVFNK